MKARVASAGTGKTTSLVERILVRIGRGTPLRRIAAVTFTHTAAAQLRDRVREGVRAALASGTYLDGLYTVPGGTRSRFEEARDELDGLTATTIHGFMIGALRLVAPAMGLRPEFAVLAEWEARAIFAEELASLLFLAADPEHELHGARTRLGDAARSLPAELFDLRSLAETIRPDEDADARAAVDLFQAAYARYRDRLGADALAPADVEHRAVAMMRTPGARERVVSRSQVVLVDEFQDVNPIQGAFFEALEDAGADVEVVGDPKQSIYGFRHADVEVFRRALERGEPLPPLTETRRHAAVLARFLNSLTDALAERRLGFEPEEAPHVTPVGDRADVRGRVEIHWVTGEAPIARLRDRESRVLADRLRHLHESRGYAYEDMALLARSYASLREVQDALTDAGVPWVMLQGRGYYERSEIRDLVHALRVGVEPSGASLAAWLRSPFAQLPVADVERIVASADPKAELEAAHPAVAGRVRQIRAWTRGRPLDALKELVRAPFLDGRTYVSYLDERARENVDALLFTVAARPPEELAVLLERLALLARQAEAGDVPQSGEGVSLLTVHRSKGLEWPVVAVFDLGRMTYHGSDPLYLHPDTGRVSLPGSPGFAAARAEKVDRDEQETYRLFYVAASRPREVLVMTGSVKGGARGAPEGWAVAVDAMGLGPGSGPWDRDDFVLHTHAPDGAAAGAGADRAPRTPPATAPWTERTFSPHPLPPIQSPSRFEPDAAVGPPDGPGAAEGSVGPGGTFAEPEWQPGDGPDLLPGRGAAIGTLVHFAISRGWRAGVAEHRANLRAQEIVFPFTDEERDELVAEVEDLLDAYWAMVGDALPALDEREEDRPELPFAMRIGATVWQGVIDRLYRVGERWYLDDYKTDRVVAPERYRLQAAVYRRAAREALGVEPAVRLVYVRSGSVVTLDDATLRAALASIPDGA